MGLVANGQTCTDDLTGYEPGELLLLHAAAYSLARCHCTVKNP